jgi:hypothetical protein
MNRAVFPACYSVYVNECRMCFMICCKCMLGMHLSVTDRIRCLLSSLILGPGSLWLHERLHDRVLRSL